MKKEKNKKKKHKKERNKKILAIIFLISLIIFSLFLTYLKFFPSYVINNNNIKEVPVNDSSSQAIHNALKTIVENFNESENVKKYEMDNNAKLTATVNNYSIFISHSKEVAITYEFTYNDLYLVINVKEDNPETFQTIYKFLIEAIQMRINNNENIDEIVDDFLLNNTNYIGLEKNIKNDIIEYRINITEKLKKKTTS